VDERIEQFCASGGCHAVPPPTASHRSSSGRRTTATGAAFKAPRARKSTRIGRASSAAVLAAVVSSVELRRLKKPFLSLSTNAGDGTGADLATGKSKADAAQEGISVGDC